MIAYIVLAKTIYAIKTAGYSPNGDDTFLFFDDFEGSELNTSKWEKSGGSYSISNSHITFTQGSGWGPYIYSKTYTLPISNGYVIYYLARTISSDAFRAGAGNGAPPYNRDSVFTIHGSTSQKEHFVSSDSSHADDVYGSYNTLNNVWYVVKGVRKPDDTFIFTLYDSSFNVLDSFSGSIAYPNAANNKVVMEGFKSWEADWIFIKKYTPNEPTVTVSDIGGYYKISITNNEAEELTNYQIAIPISDLDISSSSESIEFSDISPVFSVGLNQNITYTEFKVNYDVTHSCYYNNVSEGGSEVNLTLTATNLNDSTTLYTQTFVNVSENQTVSYTYTIQQTDAHDTIQFTCTYTDELGNYLSETINKTVENSLPTTPTNLSITGIPKVSEQINFTAIGSTDADGDSITYYYQVYNLNDEEVKQAYNTTSHYTIQVSDAHDILVIYVKAYDGFNYSGNISESVSVQNSNPEITSVNLPSTLFIKDTLNFSVNFTDIDNDTLMTLEVYIMDGSTALLKRVTNYTTGQLTNFSIPADYWGNQTLQFKIIDAYNGYDEQNITQYVKWANVTFNYLNELDRTTMSTNSLSNKVMTIEYEDDTTTLYTSFETNLVFDKPVESVKFSYTSGSNTFRREYTLNGGTETKNIYLIDYTSITPIVTTLYLLGSSGSNSRLEIYTPLDGQISNQILDVSSGVDFIMLPNKEYQIRMYEGDSVRELGKIARAYSGIYYLQITQNLLDLVAVRGNVEWNAEWINDTLRVEFNDSDNQTDYLKLEIFDSENNLVYSSENYGYSQYTFTIISLNKSEQYLLKLTFQKSGITYEEMKYFREGREVLLPTDIPTNFVKMGTILVIILIAILSTAYASSIFTFVVAIITLIFTYFGWISVPYSLIGIFIVIALFKLYLEASREGGG